MNEYEPAQPPPYPPTSSGPGPSHRQPGPQDWQPLRKPKRGRKIRPINVLAFLSVVLSLTFLYGIGSVLAVVFGVIVLIYSEKSDRQSRGVLPVSIPAGIAGIFGAVYMIIFLGIHNLPAFL